jgi:Type IV secretion system pilin
MNITLKKVAASLLMIPVLAFGISAINPAVAMAADCPIGTVWDGLKCADPNKGEGPTLQEIFTNIINAALFIVGAASVLMLIYGGIRYTLSAGNATHVTAAKNTIMYALIGLIVAVLAYAIVNFVLVAITGATS